MVYFTPYLTPSVFYSRFVKQAATILPLAIMVTYLIPVISLTKKIVDEKELLLKSGMKLMGLSDLIYYLSYWTHYFVYQTLISGVLAGLLAAFILPQVHYVLIFVPMLLFSYSSIAFTTMMTTFFKKTYIAIVFNMFAYFISYYFYLMYDNYDAFYPAPLVCLGSILAPLSVYFFVLYLVSIQSTGVYMDLNLNSFLVRIDGFNLLSVLLGQTVGIVLFMFLTYYFDQIIPSTNDVVEKPWFVFVNVYTWFKRHILCIDVEEEQRRKRKLARERSQSHILQQYAHAQEDGHLLDQPLYDILYYYPQDQTQKVAKYTDLDSRIFEPYSPLQVRSLDKALRIRHVSKKYAGNDYYSLQDVNLDILKDEILVLLGPNGAGKSTLINILVSNVDATKGDIHIDDYTFEEYIRDHRDKIGICPQYNIIFPNLTVMEHMQLFSIFKGVDSCDVQSEIERVNYELRLNTFLDRQACNLSGGQARRLAISVALIGKCELVVLDEPTAGLDPTSRRELWDLLKKTKFNRKILMSTHYMDEAEYLGDRVAMIDEGLVKAVGSVNYLRRRICSGTSMEVAYIKGKQLDAFNAYLDSIDALYEYTNIKSDKTCYIIKGKRNANQSGAKEHESHCTLDEAEVETAIDELVYEILIHLESIDMLAKYNVRDFNISQPKLDDLFFRIIKNPSDNQSKLNPNKVDDLSPSRKGHNNSRTGQGFGQVDTADTLGQSGSPIILPNKDSCVRLGTNRLSQPLLFWTNIKKNWRYNRKDLFGIFCELLFPLAFILVGIILGKLGIYLLKPKPDYAFDYNRMIADPLYPFANMNITYAKSSLNNPCFDSSFNELFEHNYNSINPGLHLVTNDKFYELDGSSISTMFLNIDKFVQYTHQTGIYNNKHVSSKNYKTSTDESNEANEVQDKSCKNALDLNCHSGPSSKQSQTQDYHHLNPKLNRNPPPMGSLQYFNNGVNAELNAALALKADSQTHFMHYVFNFKYPHAIPSLLNSASTSIIQTLTGNSNISIKASNFPLPYKHRDMLSFEKLIYLAFVEFTTFALILMTVAVVHFLMLEKEFEMKNLLNLSGMNPLVYWTSNLLFNYVKYCLVVLVLVLLVVLFDLSSVYTSEFLKFQAFVATLFLAGLPLLTFTYLISLGFKSTGNAMLFVMLVLSSLGSIFYMLYELLDKPDMRAQTNDLIDWIYIFMSVLPVFNLKVALNKINAVGTVYFDAQADSTHKNCFAWDVTGKWNVINVVMGAAYLVLVLVIENSQYFSLLQSKLKIEELGLRRENQIKNEADLLESEHYDLNNINDELDQIDADQREQPHGEGNQDYVDNPNADMQEYDKMADELEFPVYIEDALNKEDTIKSSQSANLTGMHLGTGYHPNPVKPKYAIEARNVIKHYGLTGNLVEYTDKKLALKGVTFKIPEGECFVMLGSNGAGKSTLFKTMMSELAPTAGSVKIKGMDLNAQNLYKIRKYVGYCPQTNSNYFYLTVYEHLELILEVKNVQAEWREGLIAHKLAEVGLGPFRDRAAGRLSGGNQRKLNYAIASICNPELLFLDEPTASMDPISRKNINENIVRNKNSKNTIFYCTHIIDEAEYVSDRIAIMINGKIRALGSASALKNKYGKQYMLWVVLDIATVSEQELAEMEYTNLELLQLIESSSVSLLGLRKSLIQDQQTRINSERGPRIEDDPTIKLLEHDIDLSLSEKQRENEESPTTLINVPDKYEFEKTKENDLDAVYQIYESNKWKVCKIDQWLSKACNGHQVDEIKFNMFKVKVDQGYTHMSTLHRLSMQLKALFPYIKQVSIDSVNLEEIFWNMNNNYKVEN